MGVPFEGFDEQNIGDVAKPSRKRDWMGEKEDVLAPPTKSSGTGADTGSRKPSTDGPTMGKGSKEEY